MSICEGARFKTFQDFEKALQKYQIEKNVEYVIKSSKSVEKWNEENSSKKPFEACIKYKYAYYECTFGKQRPTESTGIRPQQR